MHSRKGYRNGSYEESQFSKLDRMRRREKGRENGKYSGKLKNVENTLLETPSGRVDIRRQLSGSGALPTSGDKSEKRRLQGLSRAAARARKLFGTENGAGSSDDSDEYAEVEIFASSISFDSTSPTRSLAAEPPPSNEKITSSPRILDVTVSEARAKTDVSDAFRMRDITPPTSPVHGSSYRARSRSESIVSPPVERRRPDSSAAVKQPGEIHLDDEDGSLNTSKADWGSGDEWRERAQSEFDDLDGDYGFMVSFPTTPSPMRLNGIGSSSGSSSRRGRRGDSLVGETVPGMQFPEFSDATEELHVEEMHFDDLQIAITPSSPRDRDSLTRSISLPASLSQSTTPVTSPNGARSSSLLDNIKESMVLPTSASSPSLQSPSTFSPFQFTPSLIKKHNPSPFLSGRSLSSFESRLGQDSTFKLARMHSSSAALESTPTLGTKFRSLTSASKLGMTQPSPFKSVLPIGALSPPRPAAGSGRKKIALVRSHSAPTVRSESENVEPLRPLDDAILLKLNPTAASGPLIDESSRFESTFNASGSEIEASGLSSSPLVVESPNQLVSQLDGTKSPSPTMLLPAPASLKVPSPASGLGSASRIFGLGAMDSVPANIAFAYSFGSALVGPASSSFGGTPAGLVGASQSPQQFTTHLGPNLQTPTLPPISHDAISDAIFQALFGNNSNRPPRRRNWDSDSDDDEDEEDGSRTLPKVRAVDGTWFKRLTTSSLLTSSALDFVMKRLHQKPEGQGSTVNDGKPNILAQYISPHFISSITVELPFEDDRFDSPRVNLLKALYRNSSAIDDHVGALALKSPSIRKMILSSILEISVSRRMRCKESVQLARMLNVEANFIGSVGLLSGGIPPSQIHQSLAVSINSTSGLKGQWGHGEERKGVKTRDCDASLMDLLKYTAAVDLAESKEFIAKTPELKSPAVNLFGRDGFFYHALGLSGNSARGQLACTWERLVLQQKVICSALGCYGGALGLAAGGEYGDQPTLLANIIGSMENVLRTSALIPADNVVLQHNDNQLLSSQVEPARGRQSHPRQTSWSSSDASPHSTISSVSAYRNVTTSASDTSGSEATVSGVHFNDKSSSSGFVAGGRMPSRHGLELVSGFADFTMVYNFAASLLKLWPENSIVNGVTGAGHTQVLAFVKAAEVLILQEGAFPVHKYRVTQDLQKVLLASQPKAQSPSSSISNSTSSSGAASKSSQQPALRLPSVHRDPLNEVLMKLIACMTSSHFKVAIQSLSLLNNPIILRKFFVVMEGEGHAELACKFRMRVNNPLLLLPFPPDSVQDAVDAMLENEISTFKQDLLTKLVEALRSNRTHWHPQVKAVSSQLFDWLLNFLD